jgi:hypothetical protein
MPSRFVLIAGAGTGTGADRATARGLARAARGFGLHPLLIARDPGGYPEATGDGWQVGVAGDVDAIRTLLAGEPPAGVLGDGRDAAEVAGRVAAALGLPGFDPVAVAALGPRAEGEQPSYMVQLVDGIVVATASRATGGVDVPAAGTRRVVAAVERRAAATVATLGLGWGPVVVELTDESTISGVQPGRVDPVMARLAHCATGTDIFSTVVAHAARRATQPVRPARRYASIRLLEAPAPVDPAEVRGVPGVVEAWFGPPAAPPPSWPAPEPGVITLAEWGDTALAAARRAVAVARSGPARHVAGVAG